MVLDKIYGLTNITTRKEPFWDFEYARKGDLLYTAAIFCSKLSAYVTIDDCSPEGQGKEIFHIALNLS